MNTSGAAQAKRPPGIRAPEGTYQLAAERRGTYAFQPDYFTKLTLADLGDGQTYLVFSVGGRLLVAAGTAVDPKARVGFALSAAAG